MSSMKNEAAFMKLISNELKIINDRTKALQIILNQDEIHLTHPNKNKKKRIKAFLPKSLFHAPNKETLPSEASSLNTHSNTANKRLKTIDHLSIKTSKPHFAAFLKEKFEATLGPMKTISTFNTTRSINPGLPSAIQAKKEEAYHRLPYAIKRFNRNFHIENNQLIIQPLMTDLYEPPSTQVFNSNTNEYVLPRNPTPQKVKDYHFHKSLKFKGKKLFIRKSKVASTSDLRSNMKVISELKIIRLNNNSEKCIK